MSKNRPFERLMKGLDEVEEHLAMKCPRCNLPWGVHSANLGAPGGYECPVRVPAEEEGKTCEITGNPCGSDSWMSGHPCQCKNCQAYLHTSTPLPVDLPAEILELRDALRQSERDALIELWDAAKIMCESLPIYSTSSSAFQRKQRLDAALGRVTQILGACV